MSTTTRKGGVYPGWIIVAVTSVVLLITAGSRAAPGALLLEMEADTGWSKTVLSFAAAVGFFVYGLGGPFAGTLIGKMGPRKVTILSIFITVGGIGLSSTANSPWLLYLLFGFVTGVGAGLVASVLGAVVANRWFVKKRGLVLGIFGASVSAGQLIFFPLLTWLGGQIGWRGTLLVLAGICAVLIVPVLLFMKDDPADLDLLPLGGTGESTPALPPEKGVMGRATSSTAFWLVIITFFVCGATSNGLVGQHFIPHAVDHGFTEVTAANWLAAMGIFNFLGTIGSGWLTDRVDPRKLLLGYYGFRGVSLLFLPFVHDSLSIGAFAILFGLDYIATVPPTIALCTELFGLDYIATVPPTIALCTELFGNRNAGLVYGWVFAAHQVGAAGAAWAAGAARDGLGNYDLAFTSGGLIAIAGGIAATMIRRPPLATGAASV